MRDQETAVKLALEARERDYRIEILEKAMTNIVTQVSHIDEVLDKLRDEFEALREAEAKRSAVLATREATLAEIKSGQLTKRQLYLPLTFMILAVFIAAGLSRIHF